MDDQHKKDDMQTDAEKKRMEAEKMKTGDHSTAPSTSPSK
jgi:hypothetical protein